MKCNQNITLLGKKVVVSNRKMILRRVMSKHLSIFQSQLRLRTHPQKTPKNPKILRIRKVL